MTERRAVEETLRLLTEGTVVAAFEYAAGFRIRLEREGGEADRLPQPPGALVLDLRANWWVGKRLEWLAETSTLPVKPYRGEPEDALRALHLMVMVGARVVNVSTDDDGSLTLVTSDGDRLRIEGHDEIWEHSWELYVPPGAAGHDDWGVRCDAAGRLVAWVPSSA